jgi:hypothetical protein
MIGLIILLIYNSGLFSEALGTGLARKRKIKKKKYAVLQYAIAFVLWLLAGDILVFRRGGLFGGATRLDSNNTIGEAVSGNQSLPPSQVLQGANQVGNIFQTSWFYAAFFGMLVVASVILARSILFSWQETRAGLLREMPVVNPEAIVSVEDAFRILKAQPNADPRTRIINCYQRMGIAAYRVGARVTLDQTARELEVAIRAMLGVKGPSIRELTDLFEEARYSLHPITEKDAEEAQRYLLSIASELNITLSF